MIRRQPCLKLVHVKSNAANKKLTVTGGLRVQSNETFAILIQG
jgi:hypothetical protein